MTEEKYQRLFKIEKIFCVILALIYFVTMYYRDNWEIFTSTYDRLGLLFEGNVLDFLFNWSQSLPYGVFAQFLLALWVLPIKIINIIFKISIEDCMGAYLWYKLPIAIIFYFCIRETEKLAVTLKINKSQIQYVGFFMASSLLSFLPIFNVAQIDVMYLIFMLYGIRKYIEGDYKIFIIAFAIANPMKYISIFVYIPLILLKEKRVLYIIRDIILGFVFVLFEFIIKNIMVEPSELANSQLRALLFNTISGPDSTNASVVVIAFMMVCVLAYWWNIDDNKGKKTIWISFASLAVLFTFGTTHCYWIVLLIPFLIVLIFMNLRDLKLNIALEIMMQISFVSIYVMTQSNVFGGANTFDSLVFSMSSYLMNRRAMHSTNNVILFIKDSFQYPGEYETVFPALAIVTVVAILAINFPKVKKEIDENMDCEKICLSSGMIRLIVLGIWFVVCFYCLFR